MNLYGCPPFPESEVAAFGSSTASAISETGFAAASRLRSRLLKEVDVLPRELIYAREMNRIRRELLTLCGVSDLAGLEVAIAASGTDAHLFAAHLAEDEGQPSFIVMIDAAETGSRVPMALCGAGSEGRPVREVLTVPVRLADGSPRPAAEVDGDVDALVSVAVAKGRRVLLILVDISKTGFIAPSPACVLKLQRRFPDSVDVLVDACQFRVAPPTLRAYLEQGFMVTITGSKFVTGPTFSGALLIPETAARKIRARPFSRALSEIANPADWPLDWFPDGTQANFGLLLRWEAALEDLRAFYAVPDEAVMRFILSFSDVVQARLASDPFFEALATPRPDRRPLIGAASWDSLQTIFPFLLFHTEPHRAKVPLSREQTALVNRLLQLDLAVDTPASVDVASFGSLASLRCQLGQPVNCGVIEGVPVSALRLCLSARLIVEATAQNGLNASKIIERALAVLDKTARIAASLG
ncbi:MAG: hypothetical protein K8F27_06000 [Sulfuricellaceae bacterium]|nr:hypothetical protein [Sulfuricellaceae bacterium]